MTRLLLVPIGELPPGYPDRLSGFLARRTGMTCLPAGSELDPMPAFDPERRQFDCRRLLSPLEDMARKSDARILGVTGVDLFSAVFTFVFGEARLGGSAGLFSLHRLFPTVYGLPDDPQLLQERAGKEALHEIGHLLGLTHCGTPDCVMHFSASVEEVDLKSDSFCPGCDPTVALD